MSRARLLLAVLLSFLGATVFAYVATVAVIIGYWELVGVRDSDGGAAMAVAYVFAPSVALVTGTIAAAVIASRLTLRSRAAAPPTDGETRQDQRRLRAVLGLLAGLAIGMVAASAAQTLLRSLIFESRLAFFFFDNAHELLIPFGGLIGLIGATRWTRRA